MRCERSSSAAVPEKVIKGIIIIDDTSPQQDRGIQAVPINPQLSRPLPVPLILFQNNAIPALPTYQLPALFLWQAQLFRKRFLSVNQGRLISPNAKVAVGRWSRLPIMVLQTGRALRGCMLKLVTRTFVLAAHFWRSLCLATKAAV